MTTALQLLLLAACLALAKPEGYYHQAAEFHSSAASYKNNELQHKNQDDSFYSEHGDLERKTKPKINSYSQHEEYVNPKLRNQQQSAGGNFDGSAFAANNDQQSEYFGSNLGSGNYGSSSSNYDSFGRLQTGSSSRQNAYGMHSNLEDITRRLQSDLARQLQSAVSQQYRESAAYSRSSSSASSGAVSSNQALQDLRELEEELRANLTRKFQEALYQQYGQQSQRGGYSYSAANNDNANYDNQELNDLKSQVESNLLRQLQQTVRSQYRQSSSSQSSSFSNDQEISGTSPQGTSSNYYRPVPLSVGSQTKTGGYRQPSDRPTNYYPSTYPASSRPVSYDTSYPNHNQPSSYDGNTRYVSNTARYTLTEVCHDVQSDLSQIINEVLDEENRKNTELIKSGVKPNYDQSFRFLKQALVRNISLLLEEKLRANYGNQIEKDSRSYSITPGGSPKSQPNYSIEDLENLKQQIEDNLVEKLSYGIRQQENRYEEQRSYYSGYQSSSNQYAGSANYGSTGYRQNNYNQNNNDYGTYRPVIPLNTASQTSNSETYNYLNTQTNRGYDVNPNAEVELHNIKENVEDDLSRQLQFAIRQQTKEQSGYSSSSSSSHNAADYQAILRQLTDELQRNLTQKLQDQLQQQYGSQRTKGAYSYSLSSGGSMRSSANYNNEQLEQLRTQLHDNLVRQLQEGLRQSMSQYNAHGGASSGSHSSSYGASASYSASSGYGASSSYGSAGGYGASGSYGRSGVKGGHSSNYGQMQADSQVLSEDCDDGYHHRAVRDTGRSDIPISSQNVDLSVKPLEPPSNKARESTESEEDDQQQEEDLRQRPEDIVPRPQNVYYFETVPGSQRVYMMQHTQNSNYNHLRNTHTSEESQQSFSQEDDDMTQKTEDLYQKFMKESKEESDESHSHEFSQHTEYSSPQMREERTRNIFHSQSQRDLTQQTEQSESRRSNGRLMLRVGNNRSHNQNQTQNATEQDFAQRTEDLSPYIQQQNANANYGNRQSQEDLTQQTEELSPYSNRQRNYGRLQAGNQQQSDEDLRQQTEDLSPYRLQNSNSNYGRLQSANQQRDLTQETENLSPYYQRSSTSNYGRLQSGNQQQSDEDLKQQTEDLSPFRLQSSNTNQGRLQSANQQRETEDLSSYSQRTSTSNYGRLQSGNQRTREELSTEKAKDLSQHTEDLYQRRSGNSGRLQQSSNLQSQEDLSQKTEDLFPSGRLYAGNSQLDSQRRHQYLSGNTQSREDLTQQAEDLSPYSQQNYQRTGYGRLQSGSFYQNRQNLEQQQERNNYQQRQTPLSLEKFEQSENSSKSENKSRDENSKEESYISPYGSSHHQSYQSSSAQANSNSHNSYSSYSRSTNANGNNQLQYASQTSLDDAEQASDLVQKPIKPQRAYEVQDVSHQAVVQDFPEQREYYIENFGVETTTQPGFWKRVGNKFQRAYEKITG